MNLIVILIPALLLSASFVELAVVEAAARSPRPSAGSESAERPVEIEITEEQVLVDGEAISHARAGGPDALALARVLRGIKDASPEARTLLIHAQDSVPYETVVAVMDISRRDERGLLFPDVALVAGR